MQNLMPFIIYINDEIRHDGHSVHSRAYVMMSTTAAIGDLHRNYDGHVFRSKTGENLKQCPYQNLTSNRRGISSRGRVCSSSEDSTQGKGQS